MLDYQTQKRLEQEKKPPEPCTFATVVSVQTEGLGLLFDGETEPSAKLYKYNKAITFQVGDRVKVTKVSGTYVVDYPI